MTDKNPPESPKTVAGSHATHSGIKGTLPPSEYSIKSMDVTSPKGAKYIEK